MIVQSPFVLRVSSLATEEVRISPAREEEDKDGLNTPARKRKIKKGKDVVQSKRVKLTKVVQTSTSSELGEDHVLHMCCTEVCVCMCVYMCVYVHMYVCLCTSMWSKVFCGMH